MVRSDAGGGGKNEAMVRGDVFGAAAGSGESGSFWA